MFVNSEYRYNLPIFEVEFLVVLHTMLLQYWQFLSSLQTAINFMDDPLDI